MDEYSDPKAIGEAKKRLGVMGDKSIDAAMHQALRQSVEIVEDPRIAKLEAQVAELQKDRERLEWMAENSGEIWDDGSTATPRYRVQWEIPTNDYWGGEVWSDNWRDAIDEARGDE